MSIIAEILSGTWLLESHDLQGYKNVANTILSGGRLLDEKPTCYTIIGSQKSTGGGETELINQVAVISMIGEMTRRGGACNVGVEEICSEILKAQNNPDIKGIIFYVDGPGGNADAMPVFQLISNRITKPVVGLVARACSLHYWAVSLLADHIMMENELTAEVGSVGAMIFMEKPDKDIIIIRPEESSDKNQGLIDALAGDYTILEGRLKPLAQAFQKSVLSSRPGVKEEDIKGKTFYAQEAIQRKLADSIGDMDKAYNLVLAKSEIKNLK